MLLLYNFYSLHCPLSGPDLIYISLLIIPCIIYYVTNKETLNLVKVTLDEIVKRSMYQKFDVGHLFNAFEKKVLCSPRLQLLNQFSRTDPNLSLSLSQHPYL